VNRLPSCWQQLLDTVQKHKGRRWEFWSWSAEVSVLKRSARSYILRRTSLPDPPTRTLQSILTAVHFRTRVNILYRKCQANRFCCLTF
jgi:hypothetical protein